MKIIRVYASEIASLDSNVYTGGGTDDTAALQKALDIAKDGAKGVHLIMDGAALVSHLVLYSNTTIECLGKACGFFQKEQTNNSIVANSSDDRYSINTRNIRLIGGTYNQDCLRQEHDTPADKVFAESTTRGRYKGKKKHFVFGMEFYGVENLLLRDVTIRNFRTFAFACGGFKNVTIEDCWLDLPDHIQSSNQDGFHFWGPGQYLTVRNCGGRVGDDFMNIGPDELDRKSVITDVLIDGLFFDEADQGIRLLVRDKGFLDRVTIRNISGTYRSFGFYIDSWFWDEVMGSYGNIFIENIDLQALERNYTYRPPFLFSIGGHIESLVLKNIRHHNSFDNRQLIELGVPFGDREPNKNQYEYCFNQWQKIKYISIEDLTIIEKETDPKDTAYIGVYGDIQNLVMRNITVLKYQDEPNGTLLDFGVSGKVDTLIKGNWHLKGLKTVISDNAVIGEEI